MQKRKGESGATYCGRLQGAMETIISAAKGYVESHPCEVHHESEHPCYTQQRLEDEIKRLEEEDRDE